MSDFAGDGGDDAVGFRSQRRIAQLLLGLVRSACNCCTEASAASRDCTDSSTLSLVVAFVESNFFCRSSVTLARSSLAVAEARFGLGLVDRQTQARIVQCREHLTLLHEIADIDVARGDASEHPEAEIGAERRFDCAGEADRLGMPRFRDHGEDGSNRRFGGLGASLHAAKAAAISISGGKIVSFIGRPRRW